ncbi:MAG: dGTP triphosphohydrolase [Bacteroidia bacterium]
MEFYQPNDFLRKQRLFKIPSYLKSPGYAFTRDLTRLIHSTSFRRLTGKTQLFPGEESDFFRNRLTHSIEVADVAKTIGIKINEEDLRGAENENKTNKINLDLLSFAGLAHDLGHPPFGHIGERSLDFLMKDHGRFEGNAQTFRILTKVEKKELQIEALDETKKEDEQYIKERRKNYVELKNRYGILDANCENINEQDRRLGLNLTYRSLASIIKYPALLKNVETSSYEKVEKGVYDTEAGLLSNIISNVCPEFDQDKINEFRTIECDIMDLADDITYTTYDLEDALQAGFIHTLDFFTAKDDVYENIIKKVNKKIEEYNKLTQSYGLEKINVLENKNNLKSIYNIIINEFVFGDLDKPSSASLTDTISLGYDASMRISSNGYSRREFSTRLVNNFIENVIFLPDKKYPVLSRVTLKAKKYLELEALKQFIYESQIKTSRLQIIEYRGKEIIEKIFNTLKEAKEARDGLLLPHDYQIIFNNIHNSRNRVICDFISSMTDSYAIQYYARLTSENPHSIFKPI